VRFTGGSFMFCLLRNVQMTLHGMVKNGRQRIDFVFPAQAAERRLAVVGGGFSARELNEIRRIIIEHEAAIIGAWDEHCSQR
jgi:hypothetical protein